MDGVETTTKKKHSLRGADKKEAFHREAESHIEDYTYKRPDDDMGNRKAVYYLADTDILHATMQIISEGGDNDLHYHPGTDSFWMVMKGRVRFYNIDGVIGEYGPMEGLVTPRNARYWFECASDDEELHLLHVEADIQDKVGNKRVSVHGQKKDHQGNLRFNYPPGHRFHEISKPVN